MWAAREPSIRTALCTTCHATGLKADEIWQFCYSKEKNVPAAKCGGFGYGDVWTWAAIDAETRVVADSN